jgi:tetratricopeptide (TPR) repeat protein
LSPLPMLALGKKGAHADFLPPTFLSALSDADACIAAKPDWARGYGRKGAALEGLGRLKEALEAYEEVVKMEPENAGSKQAIEALKAKIEGGGGGDQEMAGKEGGEGEAVKEEGEGAGAAAVKVEEVKETPAERAKAKGNKAFASGNFEDAIDHYSTAIDLDKGNPVLYSNRSAAYAGAGQMQSALNDAQKCINLKPMWAKGYMRKAAALMGLNRKPMAIAAYNDGLRFDPMNEALRQGLAELTGEGAAVKKEEEGGEAGTPGAAATAAAAAPAAAAAGDGTKGEATSGDASAVGEGGKQADAKAKKEEPAAKAKAATPPPMSEEEQALLSSFMSETTDLERKQQVERIIKYKLNPFEVLQLKVETATEEDMNMSYRKLSLMCHPDKCKHARAEEAFEICKKSLAELMDEDKKGFYVEVQSTAKEEAMKEMRKKRKREKEEASKNKKMRVADVDKLRNTMLGGGLRRPGREKKEEKKEEFGKLAADQAEEPFTQEEEDMLVKLTRDAAFRILMQLEKRRARAEEVFVENEKRAKVAQTQLKEKLQSEEKVDQEWNNDRSERIESWRDFQTHGKKMGIKKPKPSVSEQGVGVLPPTMGGLKMTQDESDGLGMGVDPLAPQAKPMSDAEIQATIKARALKQQVPAAAPAPHTLAHAPPASFVQGGGASGMDDVGGDLD